MKVRVRVRAGERDFLLTQYVAIENTIKYAYTQSSTNGVLKKQLKGSAPS